MTGLNIQRNFTENAVSLRVTDRTMLESIGGQDLSLDGMIARLVRLRMELGAGDLPVYDGTNCPISGASVFSADDERRMPQRVVLW